MKIPLRRSADTIGEAHHGRVPDPATGIPRLEPSGTTPPCSTYTSPPNTAASTPAPTARMSASRVAVPGRTASTTGCKKTAPSSSPTASATSPKPIAPAKCHCSGARHSAHAPTPINAIASTASIHVPGDAYASSANATSTTQHAHAATAPSHTDAGPARSRRPSAIGNAPAPSMNASTPSHSPSGGAGKRRSSPSRRAGRPSTINGTLQGPRLVPGGRPCDRASGQITESRPGCSTHVGAEDEPCSDFLTNRRAAAVGDAVFTHSPATSRRNTGSPRYPSSTRLSPGLTVMLRARSLWKI